MAWSGDDACWPDRRTSRRRQGQLADSWDQAFPPETIARIRAFLGNAWMSDRVYDAAFFEGQAERSLASARVVLGRVFPLLRPRRLVDVGCGVGTWLRAALDLGADDVFGVDGDYVDPAVVTD